MYLFLDEAGARFFSVSFIDFCAAAGTPFVNTSLVGSSLVSASPAGSAAGSSLVSVVASGVEVSESVLVSSVDSTDSSFPNFNFIYTPPASP